MQIELTELLRMKHIAHPTRIVSTSVDPTGSLRLQVTGYPWWRDEPEPTEQSIEFLFVGLSDGDLDVRDLINSEWDEALEQFDVISLAEVDWAQPHVSSIYGSTPLTEPLKLYMELHDYLQARAAFYRPNYFLNFGGDKLADFQKVTSSKSYLLARCPDSICRVICSHLDAQNVKYNVITVPAAPETRLWVRLGSSHFLCEAAYAVFED